MGKRLLTLGLVLAAFCSACAAPGGLNELPVTDDFSDCSRWSTHEDELVSLGCVDGAYRILIKDPSDMQTAIISLSTGVEMVSVEADAAYETGPESAGYGVSCWASEEQAYLFVVSPGAAWAIVKGIQGAEPRVLIGSETEDAIEGFSRTNRIRGECVGGGEEPTALALYVNGQKIATANDPDGPASFDRVGLTVRVGSDEAGGTDVRFDNFAARELEGALRPSSEAEAPIELPVAEDFSDCSRWSTETSRAVSLSCTDGAYRVLFKETPRAQTVSLTLSTAAEGLSVEADAAYEAEQKDALYGVGCWATEEDGYLFLVSPDAYWAIVKWTGGTTPSVLAESKTDNAIEGFSPAANRIRGECFGGSEEPTALALHVNGKTIATAEDPDGLTSFGEVGISVLTDSDEAGMDVRFDNFAARKLDAKPQDRESTSEPSSEGLCKRLGIRYAGTTEEGAEVCFTLTPDGGEWVEIGLSFVQASGCPHMATGTAYSEGPAPLDAPGRIKISGFTATIRGARASGVLEDSSICGSKKFKWSARRQP